MDAGYRNFLYRSTKPQASDLLHRTNCHYNGPATAGAADTNLGGDPVARGRPVKVQDAFQCAALERWRNFFIIGAMLLQEAALTIAYSTGKSLWFDGQ